MTHKPAIIAIDQGTTSSRAIAFNLEGKTLCSDQYEHKQIYPHPGWVEHDAEEIWQNVLTATKNVVSQVTQKGYTPTTIGITNQRETVVAWDKKTNEVLYHALVWQDKRTSKVCHNLSQQYGDIVKSKTGLPLDPYFSATKMQWLLDNVASVKATAKAGTLAFGTIDSFILWRLTGGAAHKTDITNACRTLLFDIHKTQWDETLLNLFNIPVNSLPTVHANAHDFGATKTGLLAVDIPIQGMAGDQQAATIGQTCFKQGMLKSTYGTGCFAVLNTGSKPATSKNGLLTTIAYQLGDDVTYALEGSIFIAGAAVQWLRDRVEIISSAKETEALAMAASDEDDVYLVPAFAGLGAPYWDSDAKGLLVGMTLDTQKTTLVRATLDAVCYQTLDLLTALSADNGHKIDTLRIDGGMVANNWLCQRLADLTNTTVERPHVLETTALGAAYCAGLQAGLYTDLADISKYWQRNKTFTPAMPDQMRKKKTAGWLKAIQTCQNHKGDDDV